MTTSGILFGALALLISPFLRGENVVLITLDTTRSDALSCYGQKGISTPVLDTLASHAYLFLNAYTPVPQTLPAHSCIMTGLYPFHNGVRDNTLNLLAENQTTLAEIFKSNGYSTGAVIAAVVLNRRFGLNQGFDYYEDAIKTPSGRRKADEVTKLALDMIPKLTPPFFLWVHYYDPHYPYKPPADVHAPTPYLGEIAFMDRSMGPFLKALDPSTTMIIAVGDHGESLLEHKELEHGLLLYEPAVRVPLLIRMPNQADKQTIRAAVSTVGIAATLVKTLKLKTSLAFDHPDLFSVPSDQPLYLETFYPFYSFGWSPLRGLIRNGYKLITSTTMDELYAVPKDAAEENDLSLKETKRLQDLKSALAEVCPEKAFGIKQSRPPQVDADLQKQLQSLGYISGTFMDTQEIGTQRLPHPKDLADVSQFIFQTGPELLQKNDSRELFNKVKEILKRDPRNVPAMTLAGLAYWRTQNYERALDIFLECLKIAPRLYYIEGNVGRSYFFLKKYAESEAHLKKALDLNPYFPEGYLYLFETYFIQDDRASATRVLDDAEKHEIRQPHLLFNHGVFLLESGRCDDALTYLQEADLLEPDKIETIGNMAFCQQQTGHLQEAWKLIQKGLALMPQDMQTLKFGFSLALNMRKEAEARKIGAEFVKLFPQTQEAARIKQIFPDL